jgi:MoaA/NifB/PqqE/SkfB family radical SAM enzyme
MNQDAKCNMNIGDISNFSERKTVYDYKMIKLELSSACNAHCQFCTMFYKKSKAKDFLSVNNALSFVKLNAAYLNENDIKIEPFFNGESLLNPNFFTIIDIILNEGCQLGDLDTNLGLDIDIEKLASLPFNCVTVNIGGTNEDVHQKIMGTSFKLVCDNLKKLAESSKRKFSLFVKMNPVADNIHQINTLDAFVSQFGNGINWKAQQTGIPVPKDLTKDELISVYEKIYSKNQEGYFRFVIQDDFSIIAKNQNCIYLCNCINANGILTLCAHDQLRHLNLGNAFFQPISEIMESEAYKIAMSFAKMRELDFCKGCN